MEAQYFTAPKVGAVLAKSLARPDGPEIVAILRRLFTGRMEKHIMGGNQQRLVQRLRRADRYGRFGASYPVVPQADGDLPVTVHSKTIIIDDDFLRVGSSNMASRSTALDTELDLAIETDDPAHTATIAGLHDRLIAEHIDCSEEEVRDAAQAEGSLFARSRSSAARTAACAKFRSKRISRPARYSAPGCSTRRGRSSCFRGGTGRSRLAFFRRK